MRSAPALLFLTTLLPAQAALPTDLMALSFNGDVVFFDSHTGAGFAGTPTGLAGINAMARLGQTMLFCNRTGPITNPQFHLQAMTPQGGVFVQATDIGLDPRGLAAHPTNANRLLAIINAAPDQLVSFDRATNATTPIGPTGFGSVQALASVGARVFAWDLTAGLLAVNANTGLATDPFPQVGTGGAAIQWLVVHTDGRLLGGHQDLFEIDPATGIATRLGPIAGGTFDLRGAEERIGISEAFGQGCRGVAGNITLGATVNPAAGQQLNVTSSGHAPSALGAMLFGLDARAANGNPLPWSLDPLLGTNGCHLFVRPDVVVFGNANAQGQFSTGFLLPQNSAFVVFYLQHAVFDPVPGGMSWSNGVQVRVGP
ncbi:MAG: hypothetical protein IPK26_16865 [Planctomycetes bacterium]|nr:hypothetical protein [Planctomycetota bacterium]